MANPRQVSVTENGNVRIHPVVCFESIPHKKRELLNTGLVEFAGSWKVGSSKITGSQKSGQKEGIAAIIGRHSINAGFRFSFKGKINFLFSCSLDLSGGYRLKFDSDRNRISLHHLHSTNLSAPQELDGLAIPGVFQEHGNEIIIFLDYTILEVYINNQTVFSSRCYLQSEENNYWGFHSQEGNAVIDAFEHIELL